MTALASFLQLLGFVMVSVGAWMYAVPLGMVVSGAALTLVGLALERSK